jgi:uncharacterized protein YqgV (UPF0045/DUF77 family)
MKLSLEISKYPLADDYIPAIADFIERLNAYPNLRIVGNTMSTQVFGDFDEVMAAYSKEMKHSYEKWGKAIFVCKFINGDLSPSDA